MQLGNTVQAPPALRIYAREVCGRGRGSVTVGDGELGGDFVTNGWNVLVGLLDAHGVTL